ncbi:hypothetical protein PtA15_6A828 [Puccinia triticina]|uniref:Uncharacterized protein n=1 Tax=Puccinia triticina TaxID=208348 RepID=A0ABY7CLU0_9BASI|nr:uncharacterized protein PtA15_6A828 [Puccinia triticina]WAQ86196.1 hypothetical protein PtA15_6A828 [Puccinia triticina]
MAFAAWRTTRSIKRPPPGQQLPSAQSPHQTLQPKLTPLSARPSLWPNAFSTPPQLAQHSNPNSP